MYIYILTRPDVQQKSLSSCGVLCSLCQMYNRMRSPDHNYKTQIDRLQTVEYIRCPNTCRNEGLISLAFSK